MSNYLNEFNLSKFDLTNANVVASLLEKRERVIDSIEELEKKIKDANQQSSNISAILIEKERQVSFLQSIESQASQIKIATQSLQSYIAAAKNQLRDVGHKEQLEIEEITNSNFAALVSWDDPRWQEWQPAFNWNQFHLPDFLRIGQTSDGVPIGIPFMDGEQNMGAIVVKGTEQDRELAQQILANLVLRVALAFPHISRFTLIDTEERRCFRMQKDLEDVRAVGDLNDALKSVIQNIKRISNDVLGYVDSFKELPTDAWETEKFEVVFVADYHSNHIGDTQVAKHLADIAKGSKSGRFLFTFEDVGVESGKDTNFGSEVVIDLTKDQGVIFDALPSGSEQGRLLSIVKEHKMEEKTIDFESLVGISSDNLWAESSIDCIETTVGDNLSVWFGSKGKYNCSHAAMAGTTGRGKSNFLHVMTLALALRYSPEELQLYLVDGKSGVEFKSYKDLPHAKVVSLNTPPLLALSVLQDLEAEMVNRYETFKSVGEAVKDLSTYRKKTGEKMPRILLITDEYKNLFEADGAEASKIIANIAAQGRAAGVHLFLSSQRLKEYASPEINRAFENIKLLIGLGFDGDVPLEFKKEARKAIDEISGPGMAVINDQGGADGSNARGKVTYLSDGEKNRLKDKVLEYSKSNLSSGYQPVVFEGNNRYSLDDSLALQGFINQAEYMTDEKLSVIAKAKPRSGGFGIEKWTSAEYPIGMLLGRRFEIKGDALFALRRAKFENVLLVGSDTMHTKQLLAGMLMSVAYIHMPNKVEFSILEASRPDFPGGKLLEDVDSQVLSCLGYQSQFFRGEEKITLKIHELAAVVKDRESGVQADDSTIIVVVSDLDGCLDEMDEKFDTEADLKYILGAGSKLGVHILLCATTAHQFSNLFSRSNSSRNYNSFNHRVVWQMSAEDSQSVLSTTHASKLAELTSGDIALYKNTPMNQHLYFKPFELPQPLDSIVSKLKGRAK